MFGRCVSPALRSPQGWLMPLIFSGTLGLSWSLAACQGVPVSGEAATGGSAGPHSAEGGAAGSPRTDWPVEFPSVFAYSGQGAQLDPQNPLGLQGSFFILEDSVDGDVAVSETPPLRHTDLSADTGGDETEAPMSRFTADTRKPCVSGTLARVTSEMGTACDPEGDDCAWDQLWGGGIGVNLNQTEGSTQAGGWNAKAWGVHGFRFKLSGSTGRARVRLVAKGLAQPEVFCAELGLALAGEVELTRLIQDCWDGSTKPTAPRLDTTQLRELHFQLVADTESAHPIQSFCLEELEVLLNTALPLETTRPEEPELEELD